MTLERWFGVILGLIAGACYYAVGFDKSGTDSHYLFAQAFLEGRLWVGGEYPWLELVPRPEGGWYTPFPPLLSVALVPFAAAGVDVDTNLIAAVMGGLSVVFIWALLGRLEVDRRSRYALVIGWAFGSQLLWVAGEGGQHLAPQVTAAALLAASLALGVRRQWPWVAGLLLGLAAASRLPVGLALPLLLWLYRPVDPDARGLDRHPWALTLAGVAIPAIVVAFYNTARFGSATEFGYGLIENVDGVSVLSEPWYWDGIVSLQYLPNGLYTALVRGLAFVDEFPWIYADIVGVSVLLTMPILWWIFDARGRLALVAGATVMLVMLPNLLHGNPGFQQIGYRFITDALPILWLLLGLAFRHSISRAAIVALAAGVAINVWLAAVFWAELPG
jgi:hypothetical protein